MSDEKGLSFINPDQLTEPTGHYSHVCVAGDLVFVSGQIPVDDKGVPQPEMSFKDQAKLVLHNISQCLSSVDLDQSRLAQVRVYITDIKFWPEFNEVYKSWAGQSKPARAVVTVTSLHYGVALEVEVVAAKR